MCNLLYVHLARGLEHGERCTDRLCVGSCRWLAFHQWLDAPLTDAEAREQQRRQERERQLMRGTIPT